MGNWDVELNQARETLRNAAWLGTDEERELIEKAVELLCGEPCEELPSAQHELSGITDEQAIRHLQSTGWMQNHDREMYESGLREKLADDSGSYDSLTICEDAISRREAIKMFTYNYKGERIPDYDCDNFPVQTSIKKVKEMLRKLPPVNPQPKTGHWIVLSPTDMYCSECNEIEHLDTSRKFCAYCGTRMVEPQESEG